MTFSAATPDAETAHDIDQRQVRLVLQREIQLVDELDERVVRLPADELELAESDRLARVALGNLPHLVLVIARCGR